MKGLTIGSPYELSNVASLQVRVVQIRCSEVNICCLFDPISGLDSLPPTSNTQAMEPPAPPVPSNGQSITTTTAKETRKPRLRRQNAMLEKQILEDALNL